MTTIISNNEFYKKDFHAWALHNAQLLKERRFDEIDIDQIADEIASMGASESRELNSRLTELLIHLLKWRYQTHRKGCSWLNSINKQRIDIDVVLEDNPSLRVDLEERLHKVYKNAKRYAANETNQPLKSFPEPCEWTLAQVLNEMFLPD